jgi:hypothetical protein
MQNHQHLSHLCQMLMQRCRATWERESVDELFPEPILVLSFQEQDSVVEFFPQLIEEQDRILDMVWLIKPK